MNNIEVIQGDITKLKVECVVNAANKTLLGGGGVDGSIHRAAGPELLKECRALNGCKTGEAKITKGYNLPASYIIHTVGPVYGLKNFDKKILELKSCYQKSLYLAKKNSIHSIAFPSISTGYYGFPHELACDLAWFSVQQWLSFNQDYDIKIIFCCYDPETFRLYNKKLQSIM